MPQPFTMLVTLTIRPDRRDDFLAALRQVLPPARREPACVFLHAHESANEPNRFVLLERWRDREEYLTEVMNRDYFQRYLAVSEAAYAAPRRVARLEPIEPE